MGTVVSTDRDGFLLGPMRRFLGLTWVGWLNYLVLRWLFVRLAYTVEPDNTVSGYKLLRWYWPLPWSSLRRVGDRR